MSIEKEPSIRTVIMKYVSSGSTGDKTGSAIPPKVPRIPGFIISRVIKTIIMSIIIIEPPGGCGGGGLLPLDIDDGQSIEGMNVGFKNTSNSPDELLWVSLKR
jgi:hypothetical protein